MLYLIITTAKRMDNARAVAVEPVIE
jgi:hypothetical protein